MRKLHCKTFALLFIFTNFGPSWVRVYQVGKDRILEGGIEMALRKYTYWETMQKTAGSDSTVLDASDSFWEEIVGRRMKAEEELSMAIKTWVKS